MKPLPASQEAGLFGNKIVRSHSVLCETFLDFLNADESELALNLGDWSCVSGKILGKAEL